MAPLRRAAKAILRSACALAPFWIFVCSPRLSGQPSEHEVKAAFVLNFIRFVNWPSTQRELIVCQPEESELGQAAGKMMANKLVSGRPVKLLTATLDSLPACSVLLIGGDHTRKLTQALAAVDGKPVLTVGESSAFLAGGGMLALLVEDRRVVFEANVAAIRRSGLDISSNLLQLARKAHAGGQP
ncbi:MAG: YfiR family protein [Bryobacterales bacterium]|nr:YfiR family protein [Bryobacterales bacterium]